MIDAEPNSLLDAEIAIDGGRTPGHEKAIGELLASIEGVVDPHLYGGLVVLRYDPLVVTKAQIRSRLESAGIAVLWIKAGPASPILDAITGDANDAAGN